MKVFKEIFARIWAVWGIISFIATFLIVFIPSMLTNLLPEPKSSKVFSRISTIWMDVWLFLVACPLKVVGKENFKPGQTYVVICNHNSLMDVPISSPYIPGGNKTIAKTSFAKIPLFGFYYKKGSVLVDRKIEASRKASYIRMKEVLAMGLHMCIYPEGTRNKTKELLANFHNGAFKLAHETGIPIIPGVIFNTKKVMPVNKSFYLLPHRLEFHFLPAIPSDEPVEVLRAKAHEIMLNYYSKNQ